MFLWKIFNDIIIIGFDLTKEILSKKIIPTPQDNSLATYYKRRTPDQSEITKYEINNSTAEYLYNKIRMLEDPYPNAFIRTSDGKKLIIKTAELIE